MSPSSEPQKFPAPPLNGPAELVAPAEWRCVDFISDLHLSAASPGTFAAWADYLRGTSADAVFMLGDVFDMWVGDDSRSLEFEGSCMRVLAEASTSRRLFFMAGNRDFMVGADMLRDCGMTGLADPTLLIAMNQRILLTHGDSLCLSDLDYQRFRSMVRDVRWQQQALTKPLDVRLQMGRSARHASESRKQDATGAPAMGWADVDADAAVDWLRACATPTMVHGHTHRPGSNALAEGFTRHVLSDWDLDHAPYRSDVLRLTADGLTRLLPAEAATPRP